MYCKRGQLTHLFSTRRFIHCIRNDNNVLQNMAYKTTRVVFLVQNSDTDYGQIRRKHLQV